MHHSSEPYIATVDREHVMSDDYKERIFHAAMNAVVDAKPGEAGGIVDLPLAFDALLSCVATLALQSGNYPTPRDQRQFAESCGKAVRQMMRDIAAQSIDWEMEPIGPTN